MSGLLDEKKALVTGATRGIGLAIATRLIADGSTVHVTGTKPGGKGPDGSVFHGIDFTDTAATRDFADAMAEQKFDILVNNAGINEISPFSEIDPDIFAEIQQVNVTAPMLLCRALVPAMAANGWGRIVNISSIWGKISKEHRGPYSASKFALDGMTAALAAEVAQQGILANCIAPGFIATEMTERVLGPQGIAEMIAEVPVGRLGKPEEIAAFVAWLAGPENTYISGQNIAIDGGFSRV